MKNKEEIFEILGKEFNSMRDEAEKRAKSEESEFNNGCLWGLAFGCNAITSALSQVRYGRFVKLMKDLERSGDREK